MLDLTRFDAIALLVAFVGLVIWVARRWRQKGYGNPR
jgi:hypothetical protein